MSLKYRIYNIGLHIFFQKNLEFLLSYTKDSNQGLSLRSINYFDLVEIFAERFSKLNTSFKSLILLI